MMSAVFAAPVQAENVEPALFLSHLAGDRQDAVGVDGQQPVEPALQRRGPALVAGLVAAPEARSTPWRISPTTSALKASLGQEVHHQPIEVVRAFQRHHV
jgi:hypothetical protein